MIFDFLMGSFEEHETITLVNHELQQWKQKYSEAGTMVKKKQLELTLLLNSRYQYRIEFKQTKNLTQQFFNNLTRSSNIGSRSGGSLLTTKFL